MMFKYSEAHAALLEELREYYQNVRVLDDGTIVGTTELAYTRAICIGLDYTGWSKRFCFENRSVAVSELQKLKTGNDEPEGYIARRGDGADEWYANKPDEWASVSTGA